LGKKRSRSKKISKGQRPSISRDIIKAVSRELTIVDQEMNKINAWLSGKNPWITIPNPSGSKKESFVKVKANSFYGDPKFAKANLFK